MAEFLIRNYPSHLEAVPQKEKDKWSQEAWDKYNRRRMVGDIVSVQEDGWNWSKAELPNVVKRPDIPIEVARKYRLADREIKLTPAPTIENFYRPEFLRDKTKSQKDSLLQEQLNKITDIKVRKGLQLIQIINIQDIFILENRDQLDKDYVDMYATVDSKEIKIDYRSTKVKYARSRFKIIDDNKIWDKYLDCEVSPIGN